MKRRLALGIIIGALLWTPALPRAYAIPVSNAYFITQMRDRTWNPAGPAWSTNCGPACLVMALTAFGKEASSRPSEAEIRRVRAAITGNADGESLISLEALREQAERHGLAADYAAGLDEVRAQVGEGRLVIVAGNPACYNTRLKTRDYDHFSGPHFILVTGLDADKFWVNDPLSRRGALKLSAADLTEYMAYKGWKTGLALYPRPLDAGQPLFEAQR